MRSSPSPPRVLLLGGHGKVSLLLTPLLTARSWHVISLIRDPAQTPDILAAAAGAGPGTVETLVENLEDVRSEGDARRVLEAVRPDYVVWSAGAGGKGNPALTFAIDRDAAQHFMTASLTTPTIKKFLTISALSSRRLPAPWWDTESTALVEKMNKEILPNYYHAKLAADETLTVLGEKRMKEDGEFRYICLRPGGLSDEVATGRVCLGKTGARGLVSRGDVADVAGRLLERGGVGGWFDLVGGEEEVGEAVERVVREGVSSMDGEDVSKMEA